MKVIKKINNNVAVCLDSNDNELIAFGKGIGFPAMPYELTDLSTISMTFYRMDESFYKFLKEIPEEVSQIAAIIVKKAQMTLKCNLNPNLLPGLADHINFAIKRMEKYKEMKMVFSYDIEKLYPEETELGRYAVKLVEEKLSVKLPKSEITNIAMHFVNAEESTNEANNSYAEKLIEELTNIIETDFETNIDRKGFNYNRFEIHLRYFLKRIQDNKQFLDDNGALFKVMKEENPEIYECALHISTVIDIKLNSKITEDELLYLMMHISRILKNNK